MSFLSTCRGKLNAVRSADRIDNKRKENEVIFMKDESKMILNWNCGSDSYRSHSVGLYPKCAKQPFSYLLNVAAGGRHRANQHMRAILKRDFVRPKISHHLQSCIGLHRIGKKCCSTLAPRQHAIDNKEVCNATVPSDNF